MKKHLLLIVSILLIASPCLAADARLRPDTWATPVIAEGLENWHKVDDLVYRSEQPNAEEMRQVAGLGIGRVLNLREFHDDEDEAEGTDLTLYHLPMNAGKINDETVVQALRLIKSSDEPILIHCWHGADRTGTIVAMYRIVEQGWSKEAALDELENGGFGYHSIYRNIPRYIKQADVEKIRAEVNSIP